MSGKLCSISVGIVSVNSLMNCMYVNVCNQLMQNKCKSIVDNVAQKMNYPSIIHSIICSCTDSSI